MINRNSSLKIKIRKEKREKEYNEIIDFYNKTFKDDQLAYIHRDIIKEAAEERGIMWKYLRKSIETYAFLFNGRRKFNFENVFRLAEEYQKEILEVEYA